MNTSDIVAIAGHERVILYVVSSSSSDCDGILDYGIEGVETSLENAKRSIDENDLLKWGVEKIGDSNEHKAITTDKWYTYEYRITEVIKEL